MRPIPSCTRRQWLALSALAAAPAWAQEGGRPVRIVVPFAPGGGNDVLARQLANGLSSTFGRTWLVDNKAGAGGNIGTDAVAKAMPDGYTIGLSAISSLAIAPSLYARLPYSVERDLAPISLAGYTPCAIVAHPGAPFDDLAGLIAYAKAHPGKLSYGTSGLGTSTHLAAEYFQSIAGVSMLHVPYKGTSQIAQDLLAGTIPLSFESSLTTTLPNVREGRVKVIAVTSARRSRALPQVATVAEQGFAGFDVVTWFGLIGPARLPRELAQRISGAWQTGSATPLARQAFENIGADPQAGSPQQFGDFMRSETQRWGALIRKLGIQLD